MFSKKEVGNLGEELAIKFLRNKKYLILQKNFYIKGGEVDIIVKDIDKQEIVFVEVKTRTSIFFGQPEEAVNQIKKNRMAKSARKYLYQNNYSAQQNFRFDSISIILDFKNRQAKIRRFECI